MKWYKTAETNYLAHEVITFFMREENYDKYKLPLQEGTYEFKKHYF